jgi:hypothetical protein
VPAPRGRPDLAKPTRCVFWGDENDKQQQAFPFPLGATGSWEQERCGKCKCTNARAVSQGAAKKKPTKKQLMHVRTFFGAGRCFIARRPHFARTLFKHGLVATSWLCIPSKVLIGNKFRFMRIGLPGIPQLRRSSRAKSRALSAGAATAKATAATASGPLPPPPPSLGALKCAQTGPCLLPGLHGEVA